MNIEEAIKYIKNDIEIDKDTASWFENGNTTKEQIEESIDAYETLLTAYEKEKEKNKKIDEFCRKELAFERRLKRENRQPDKFNQGRFYVSENIRKIIEEE